MGDNWKTYRVSDFIEINPKVPLKKGMPYSFVEMKDLNASNKYVLPSVTKELNGGARFQNRDTLFARITPCLENGKICQVKNLENNLGFGSTEFLIFRGKKDISDSDFIFYLSRAPFFRKFAEAKMIGTSGRQRVAKDAFENFVLELPNIKEQRAIASILSALDDKIELNLQMNKTLEDMAMALYKHWFVDFGPFQDGEMVDSELGEIPKGWEVKRLSLLANFKNGKGLMNKFKKEDGAYNVFGSNGIIGRTNEFMFDKPVIAIGRVGANYGEVHYSIYPCWISDNAITVQPMDQKYYWWLLQRLRLIDYNNFVAGSAQPLITQGAIKEVECVVPKDVLLIDFSRKLDLLFSQLQNNISENQTLTTLRDTLLPKLISGELRVKGVEKMLTEVL